jgi:hypothetical protein
MKKYQTHIIWLVIAIVAFVGGWFIGNGMASSAAGGRGGAFALGSSTRAGFTGGLRGAGGGFVAGQIMSISSSSLTLALPNGNSEIVFYSGTTSVIKPTPAPVSSLTPGTMVMIGGTANSDGSLTAQSIQVRTASSTGGFGGGGGGGGGASAPAGGAAY